MAKKDRSKKKAREAERSKARQAARDQAKRRRSRGSGTVSIPEGVGIFKPPEDASTTISIVPFTVGADRALLSDVDPGERYYTVAYKTHRNVGPEDKVVVCLKTFSSPCPICDEFNKERQSDKDYEEYKSLRSTERDLMLVINRGKLELMEIPWFWFGKPLGTEIEEDEEGGLFFFPEDEIDLKVTWETDSYGTKATRIRFVSRKDDLDEELVEQASEINLAECVVKTSYDKMYSMFHGTDDEPEDDDQEANLDDDHDEDREEEAPQAVEEELDAPTEKKLKKMDGEDLLEVADAHGIKVAKKLRKKVDGEDEDAADELREDLMDYFYPDPDDDEDSEPEEKEEEKSSRKKSKAKDGECPEGYAFGADNDAYDECDECKIFTECEKAKKK